MCVAVWGAVFLVQIQRAMMACKLRVAAMHALTVMKRNRRANLLLRTFVFGAIIARRYRRVKKAIARIQRRLRLRQFRRTMATYRSSVSACYAADSVASAACAVL